MRQLVWETKSNGILQSRKKKTKGKKIKVQKLQLQKRDNNKSGKWNETQFDASMHLMKFFVSCVAYLFWAVNTHWSDIINFSICRAFW